MDVVMGATGQVGGATAEALLALGREVRVVVRDADRARELARKGADVAVAAYEDAEALARAFDGAAGVFAMLPPQFSPAPGFPEARACLVGLVEALETARPGKVVALSSVGAHHGTGLGLVTQLHMLEEALCAVELPTAFIRAAWFMENAAWDIGPARESGEITSFLSPLDRMIPMVATADIGRVAALTLIADLKETRVIEIEGPRRYAPNDLARVLGEVLGRPVRAVAAARETWEALFRAQGATNPQPRLEMLDGINSGWIDFEGGWTEHHRGETPLKAVVAKLAAGQGAA
uniref:Putative nucleoside-diphosphate sugar epimerase n=1 Tax=Desulfovibrio sp. U5L TaxID=596152 RepID=I2PXM6_9BACT